MFGRGADYKFKIKQLKHIINWRTSILERRLRKLIWSKSVTAGRDEFTDYLVVSRFDLEHLLFEVQMLKEWGREE
jgi:hypothetical protein